MLVTPLGSSSLASASSYKNTSVCSYVGQDHWKKKQYELTNGNLIVFYAKTGSVDEKRAMGISYHDFSKVLDTVSHNIFDDKLVRYGLGRWTTRWVKNWLDCLAQSRVVVQSQHGGQS